jgi:hypothetical protein
VVGGEPRDGLGEGKRGLFALGEVRRFAPGRQAVEALLGLSDRASVLGVHVDAVGAAVDLQRAVADQLSSAGVEVDPVRFLLATLSGWTIAREKNRSAAVEVEPGADLLVELCGAHARKLAVAAITQEAHCSRAKDAKPLNGAVPAPLSGQVCRT